MKRILIFLLCLMLLSGCAGMNEPEPGTEPTVPVTEAVTGAPTQGPTEATV